MSENVHELPQASAPRVAMAPHGRTPPQSLDAERSMLGGLLLDQKAFADIGDLVSSSDFYGTKERKVFEAMCRCEMEGRTIDRISVKEFLGADKTPQLEEFVDQLDTIVPTAANLAYYAKIIRDKALTRRLIEAGSDIARLGYEHHGSAEEFADDCERRVYSVSEVGRPIAFSTTRELAGPAFKEIERRFEHDTTITGLASGLDELDAMTCGFQPGNLVLVAARPSMGKTSLALDIVLQACAAGGAAAVFSLEMSKEELFDRMLATVSRVNSQHIRTGKLADPDWSKLARGAGLLSDMAIHIDDTAAVNSLAIRSAARRLAAKLSSTSTPLKLVVVDYLQLMSGHGDEERREEQVAHNSRDLKALAKELKLPVVALSQLNRQVEQRPHKRPMMSDLRESGALEQDADLICFLYREEVYEPDKEEAKGQAEIIVGKQRNGPVGTAKVAFVKEWSSFRNLVSKTQSQQLRLDEPPPHDDGDAP